MECRSYQSLTTINNSVMNILVHMCCSEHPCMCMHVYVCKYILRNSILGSKLDDSNILCETPKMPFRKAKQLALPPIYVCYLKKKKTKPFSLCAERI